MATKQDHAQKHIAMRKRWCGARLVLVSETNMTRAMHAFSGKENHWGHFLTSHARLTKAQVAGPHCENLWRVMLWGFLAEKESQHCCPAKLDSISLSVFLV